MTKLTSNKHELSHFFCSLSGKGKMERKKGSKRRMYILLAIIERTNVCYIRGH